MSPGYSLQGSPALDAAQTPDSTGPEQPCSQVWGALGTSSPRALYASTRPHPACGTSGTQLPQRPLSHDPETTELSPPGSTPSLGSCHCFSGVQGRGGGACSRWPFPGGLGLGSEQSPISQHNSIQSVASSGPGWQPHSSPCSQSIPGASWLEEGSGEESELGVSEGVLEPVKFPELSALGWGATGQADPPSGSPCLRRELWRSLG